MEGNQVLEGVNPLSTIIMIIHRSRGNQQRFNGQPFWTTVGVFQTIRLQIFSQLLRLIMISHDGSATQSAKNDRREVFRLFLVEPKK